MQLVQYFAHIRVQCSKYACFITNTISASTSKHSSFFLIFLVITYYTCLISLDIVYLMHTNVFILIVQICLFMLIKVCTYRKGAYIWLH